ncbi:MAG: Fpg/Nei family DNA glycosylase [Actinomycetota bacterium]
MPELPDITVYVRALEARVLGQVLARVRLGNPFLLRTAVPPLSEAEGKQVLAVQRQGKRIVLALEGGLFLVLHLMIAGRLHWKAPDAKIGGKNALAAFDFEAGTLTLTEAGSKRRASLHLLSGLAALAAHDRGGLEVLEADREAFAEALQRENHTLKRSLTDPRLFSGIGNSFSDEILHRAQLSPVKLTSRLTEDEITRLHVATQSVLVEWVERLEQEAGDRFPEKVTAFRPEMAVHGRYGQPCPVCGEPVQRIVYAENESNYCAQCQTGGKLLADRAMSRLLRQDWPRTVAELEERTLTARS